MLLSTTLLYLLLVLHTLLLFIYLTVLFLTLPNLLYSALPCSTSL